MTTRLALALTAMVLSASACAGTTPAPTPSPSAGGPSALTSTTSPSFVSPIPLPPGCKEDDPCRLAAGTYVLTGEFAFMQGMTISVPASWKSGEQDLGEFSVAIDGAPGGLLFWKDLTPVSPDGTPVPGAVMSSAGILQWLQTDPDFVTSAPQDATIGDGLRATTILVGVSRTAKNADPQCPVAVCIGILKDAAHWGQSYAIGRQDDPLYFRLYLADIVAGSVPHTLVVGLDAGGAAGLPALESAAKPVLDSVRLPPSVTAAPAPSAGPPASSLVQGCSDVAPRKLAAGTWVTTGEWAFIPGLTITLPDAWSCYEQDLGEFRLAPDDLRDDTLLIWKDVTGISSDGTSRVIAGIPRTPDGLIGYFKGNSDYAVTDEGVTTIAGGVPARTVVVGVSDTARFKDRTCPVFPHCADLLTDPVHWKGGYGFGAPTVVRLYLASVGHGADTHLLVVATDAPNAAELKRFTEIAKPTLDSIRLPSVIGSQ